MKNVERVYEILNKYNENNNDNTRATTTTNSGSHNYFRSSFHNNHSRKNTKHQRGATAASGSSTTLKATSSRTKSSEDLINLDGGGGGDDQLTAGGELRGVSGGGGLEEGCEDFAASEEARLAEEAVAANLKLIKRQKAKFLRLQRILSRNQFIIPMCVLFTIASSLATYASTLTDFYEYSSFNVSLVEIKIVQANEHSLALLNSFINTHRHLGVANFTLADVTSRNKSKLLVQVPSFNNTHSVFNATRKLVTTTTVWTLLKERYHEVSFYELITPNSADEYFTVNKFDYLASDNSLVKTNVLYTTHSGIWRVCNYLSNETRKHLNVDECLFYRKAIVELNNDMSEYSINHHNEESGGGGGGEQHSNNNVSSDPRRDLIRTHNATACCAIVCYILLAVTWITSLVSAVSKKVPPTLASCVLNSLIAVFNLLLVAIYHRKILAEMKQSECFDLNILFDVVCSSRTVTIGYSLAASWLSLIFTAANAVCWFHIAKMQKLLFSNGLIA